MTAVVLWRVFAALAVIVLAALTELFWSEYQKRRTK